MSIQAIARVLDLEDERLDASSKLVLIGIANHTSTNGQCFPSVRLLMRYSGMAERTVRGVVRKLEDHGFIRVERRDGKSNIYFLTLPDTPANPAETPAPAAPTPASDAPPTPAPAAPITVTIEPSGSASDAREMLAEDWRPSPGLLIPITKQYRNVDIDHQIALFIAHNRSKGTLLRDPDEAFKAWMLRTKELKTPPKARAAAASGPVPVGPEALATALEHDAEADRFRNPDVACETYLNAAKAWARLGNDGRSKECIGKALALAREGSWHEEQIFAFTKEKKP